VRQRVGIALVAACAGIGTTAPTPWPGGTVYRVRVDTAAAAVNVMMDIPRAPHVLRLAFARHPEYDDQIWRDVQDLVVESGGHPVSLAREDSAVWRATLPAGAAVVTYRLTLPRGRTNRRAWSPVVAADGALVGGDTFLYVVGDEQRSVRVILEGLPRDWQVATGLEPRGSPNAFQAPSATALVDSPILLGRLRSWTFTIDGVPIVSWLDDVMRALLAGYAGPSGFRSEDLERVTDSVCRCDLRAFFAAHVRGADTLDLNPFLASLGWRAVVAWGPATDSTGRAVPDRRIYAYVPSDSTGVRVVIWNPLSAWGRAGLQTNDVIVAVDGAPVQSAEAFRSRLAAASIGNSVAVRVARAGRAEDRVVHLTGYDGVAVRVEDASPLTERQHRMRALWMTGGGLSHDR
jgi:predicted metalloprotease with PDZ domain